MRAALFAAGVAAALGIAALALAHDFSPGVLALDETAPGRFDVAWTAPLSGGEPLPIEVRFPRACRRDGATLACTPPELDGEIVFEARTRHRTTIAVTIRRLDGSIEERVGSGHDVRVRVGPSAASTEDAPQSMLAWLALGIEHIATGLDHVAFVLGLLLVTGLDRRLLVTITAFTVAHSITLALGALDVVALASAPVEATIAASVLLVAREGTHDEPTLTRRAPWLVALAFGLVHGFGFAGALAETGLPQGSAAWALLWFNVGVELGQLAIVALVAVAALAVARARQKPRLEKLRPYACYALGAVAAYWLVARTAAMLTAPS